MKTRLPGGAKKVLSGVEKPIRLSTGREWDKETGLYYYNARYYDPMEGRFIQKDPIGFAGGDVNLFAYTKNNPINFKDPSGMSMVSDLYDWYKWGDKAKIIKKLADQIAKDKDKALDALMKGKCEEAQIYQDEANALYKIYLELTNDLATIPPPGTTISNPAAPSGK